MKSKPTHCFYQCTGSQASDQRPMVPCWLVCLQKQRFNNSQHNLDLTFMLYIIPAMPMCECGCLYPCTPWTCKHYQRSLFLFSISLQFLFLSHALLGFICIRHPRMQQGAWTLWLYGKDTKDSTKGKQSCWACFASENSVLCISM